MSGQIAIIVYVAMGDVKPELGIVKADVDEDQWHFDAGADGGKYWYGAWSAVGVS